MADELIDELDTGGNVIGTIMKSEAHATGALHREIHAYLVNSNNELLIQQRTTNKDIYPGLWDISCGGHVAAGENAKTSVLREVKEELGITVNESDIKYLFTILLKENCGRIANNMYIEVYMVKTDAKLVDIKVQKDEVSDVKYVTFDKFTELQLSKDKSFIPRYAEHAVIIKHLMKALELEKQSS